MKTEQYKTNIKCSACVEKVTPFLDEAVGHDQWSVDLRNPSRVLSIHALADESEVKKALEKAGYKAEKLS